VRARFSEPVQVHPASYTMDTGFLTRGLSGRGVALTTHPIWGRGQRKRRAIPLLLFWAFVACSRVTFTLTKCKKLQRHRTRPHSVALIQSL